MTLHYATRMNDEAHGHAQGHGDPLGLAFTKLRAKTGDDEMD